jgi:glutamyl/glutaminyl-tRNA synthetase
LLVYLLDNRTVLENFMALPRGDSDILVINFLAKALPKMTVWSVAHIQALIQNAVDVLNLGKGKVMKPLRKCITGFESGPNLVDCLSLIPLNDAIQRVQLVQHYVNSTTSN